eukprot:7273223-Pyramimonas_sp.AAC.1
MASREVQEGPQSPPGGHQQGPSTAKALRDAPSRPQDGPRGRDVAQTAVRGHPRRPGDPKCTDCRHGLVFKHVTKSEHRGS